MLTADTTRINAELQSLRNSSDYMSAMIHNLEEKTKQKPELPVAKEIPAAVQTPLMPKTPSQQPQQPEIFADAQPKPTPKDIAPEKKIADSSAAATSNRMYSLFMLFKFTDDKLKIND